MSFSVMSFSNVLKKGRENFPAKCRKSYGVLARRICEFDLMLMKCSEPSQPFGLKPSASEGNPQAS